MNSSSAVRKSVEKNSSRVGDSARRLTGYVDAEIERCDDREYAVKVGN